MSQVQTQATPTPADVGECSSCGKRNSHRATRCHACHEVLPWAEGKVAAPRDAAARTTPAPKAPAKQRVADDVDEDLWWQTIGGGILLLLVGGYSYWSFAAKEAAGGMIRGKWWLILLYSLGGKWLVAGIFGVLGLLLIGFGAMLFTQRNRA